MAQATRNPKSPEDEEIDAFQDELDKLPTIEPDRAVPGSFKKGVYDKGGTEATKAPGGKKSGSRKSAGVTADTPDENEASLYAGSKEKHENMVGRGWRSGKDSVSRWRQRRMAMLIGGTISVFLVAGVIFLFGFLNIFKLDGIMSNIDAASFARLNGVQQQRSYAWMKSYMLMRMADIGENPDLSKGTQSDNKFFRASKVDTGNPIYDWYRTMRTSKFEQDVFNKHGIYFTSSYKYENNRVVVRPAKIVFSGEEIPFDLSSADYNAIDTGNFDYIANNSKLSKYIDIHFFNNDAEARAAIKEMVNTDLRSSQVFKRRQVRKDIQNMTGVRNWRFFDGTRTKIDNKKIEIRNKIIAAAVPDSTKSGKFIRCLFGISDCRFSADPSSPDNQSPGSIKGDTNVNNAGEDLPTGVDPKTGAPVTTPVDIGSDTAKALLTNIANKVAAVLGPLNYIQILDSLDRINHTLKTHQLSAGVAIARGTQAMGLYQVFETARDQMKTGDLNAAEVNSFMQVIGPAASSDAFTKVVEHKGNPAQLDNSVAAQNYCSAVNQAKLEKDPTLAQTDKAFSYAYLCASKQIGSPSNASTLEKGYNESIGSVLTPLLNAYDGVRHSFLGPIIDLVNNAIGKITGTLTQVVIDTLGLNGSIEKITKYFAGKTATVLGAGPIMSGSESGGEYMNWLMQGGAYTAEASSRSNGASLTTVQSAQAAELAAANYNSDQKNSGSVFERYLSTSNPSSAVSHSLFALSTTTREQVLSKLNFGSLFSNFGSLASHHAAADQTTGYEASSFAGIQTYDFPVACYNYQPLTATPQNGTNIQQIFPSVPSSDLTWDLVTNSDQWYQYVYKVARDDTASAQKVYNCNLLDTSTRGSLGFIYGYKNDNGLN